jgi:hypothetical protein
LYKPEAELLKCFDKEMTLKLLDWENDSEAKTIFKTWLDLEYACKCYGKKKCEINLDPGQYFNKVCSTTMDLRMKNFRSITPSQEIPEPNVMLVAKCNSAEI